MDCLHGLPYKDCATCAIEGSAPQLAPRSGGASGTRPRTPSVDREQLFRRVTEFLNDRPRAIRIEVRRRLETRLDDTGPLAESLGHREARPLNWPSELPVLQTDEVELAMMRALARTSPSRQFGVTPDGQVFASKAHGYSQEAQRLYVTTLSPLLRDIGWHFNVFRGGTGGRFYESVFVVSDAMSHQRLLRITTTQDAA